MKKKILALAIGAAVTAFTVPAMSADVTVSGRAHMSVDSVDTGSVSGMDVSSNSSRIRFAAKTDVVEGLTAIMQLEQTVDFDQTGGGFASRDSFFGLKGNFGMVRLGMFDTPTKKVRSATDMFGDRVGDARNITKNGNTKFDERFKGSVHYQTPSFSGLTFDLQVSPNGGTNDLEEDDKISTSLTFKADGIQVIGAYEDNGANSAMRLGATYDLSSQVRLAGFYQTTTDVAGGDRDVMGLGGYYKLGSDSRVRAQYYMAGENDTADSAASMFAVGYDKSFGKALTLYAVYAMTMNEDGAAFTVTDGGHGSTFTPAAGDNTSAISLGAIYNF